MSVQTEKLGDDLLHRYDLSGVNLQLDLTSPRYRLQDGQCSTILGWDVLSLNKDRPDRGRRSLGVSIPLADRPLTFAEESNVEALIVKIRSGVIYHNLPYDGSSPERETSCLRASNVGTYNPTTGQFVSSGAFSGYVRREGDRIALGLGASGATLNSTKMQGLQPNVSYLNFNANEITIPPGLTSASFADVDFMLFQGRGFAPRTPAWSSAAPVMYLVMSPEEYDAGGPWDENSKLLLLNEDGRITASNQYPVLSVETYARKNDALSVPVEAAFGGGMYKFSVLSETRAVLQGVICGNGRKFWLLSGGSYTLLLDLGSDVYLGSTWRLSNIAANRLMLVTEKFPPIILRLDARGLVVTAYNRDLVLAGMISPSKPDNLEFLTSAGLHRYPSWLMKNAAGSTSMEAGRIKTYVRLVNPYDNLYSDFVEVVEATNESIPTTLASGVDTAKKNLLTVTAGDYVTVFQSMRDSTTGFASSLWSPFLHSRAAQLEIWRTESIPSPGEGINYYREAVVHLVDFKAQENDQSGADSTYAANYGIVVPAVVHTGRHQIKLSNANLVSLPLLTNIEFSWGRLPPISRDVVSLGGVTLCFGKAAESKVNPVVYLRDYTGHNGSYGPQIKGANPAHGLSYSFLKIPPDGWTIPVSWVSSGGKVTHTPGSTAVLQTTSSIITSGVRSIVGYGISGRTAGSVTVTVGGVVGPARLDNRDFQEDVTATATGPIIFTPTSDFNGSIEYVDISGEITQTGLFTEYAWKEGDVLEVFQGGFSSVVTLGEDTNTIPLGQYPIASKVSNDTLSLYPNFLVSLLQGVPNKIRFSILRPYTWVWPFIGSDEEVWYSRTDVFAPESFSSRLLLLSRRGDIFRRAVLAGNYVVAVMDQSVHLIYLNGTTVMKDTIGDVGIGTPWEDSVAVLDNAVLWATAQGVRILQVASDVNVDGNRATLSWLTDLRFESWFREAAQNGDRVDTGVDRTNQTFRFRRFKGNNIYQVLQFSLRTNRWTLLDDDNGFRYASSRYVEADEKALPAMYSVDATGAALEVNLRSRSTAYAESIVQSDLVSPDWVVRTDSLRHLVRPVFSPLMVGDVIRFVSSDPAVNDTVRTVLTAGTFFVTFDAVLGLTKADSFVIGATRFRRRYAPMQGARRENFKTLYENLLRLRKGETPGELTLRWYEDLSDVPRTEQIFVVAGEGPINVLGSKDAQGSALELELESLDANSDFEIESVEAALREETDSVVETL